MSKQLKQKLKQKNNLTKSYIVNLLKYSPYIYLIIFVLLILVYLPTTLWHFPDGIGYYSYLPAIFKYKNYDFYKIVKTYTPGIIGITKNGFISNDFEIGYSVILLPVYLISTIFENEKVSIMLTNFFSSLAGLLSLFVFFKYINKRLGVRKDLSLITCLSLLVGTPLLFYCYAIPQNPHNICTLLCSIYLSSVLTIENKNPYYHIFNGVILGIISSIRLQRFILFIPYISIMLSELVLTGKFKRFFFNTILFFAGFLIGYSPQILNSKIIFGQFLPPKLYTISVNKYVLSSFYEVLFSSYHSVLLWTPLILLSIIGLIFGLKYNFALSLSLIIVFIIETFIISMVISPGGGASFGIRYYTDLIFIFGLGLYYLLNFSKKNVRTIIILVILVCSIWTLILFVLSIKGEIDLLLVYDIKVFLKKVISGLKNVQIVLKPRVIVDTEIYFFLFLIIIATFYIVNTIYQSLRNPILLLVVTVIYLIFFNFNLIKAGCINRVVYQKDVFEQLLTLEDYQRFYILAGIKIRLDYYSITQQKEKYDFYLTLKEKLYPRKEKVKKLVELLFKS